MDYLPPNVTHSSDFAEFSIESESIEDGFLIKRSFASDYQRVPVEDYETLKKFFEKVNRSEAEQVILVPKG